jgi:hypothetical protein
MRKVLVMLLFALFAVTMMGFAAQEPAAAPKAGKTTVKAVHWSGAVDRIDKENSILTVRRKGGMTKQIHYDASTKWSTRSGGTVDPSTLKEGDRVVCNGKDEGGKFVAIEIILQAGK